MLRANDQWTIRNTLFDVVEAAVNLIDNPIVDEAVSQGKTIDHVEELIRLSLGFFFRIGR